jgi:predicted dehydrogenase
VSRGLDDPTVGLAQIGCGLRATHQVAAILPAVEPVVCCDLSEPAARAMQERFGFRRTSADALEAAADPAVGLVNVVLPPDLNAPMVERLAPLGKPIVVEKPLSPFEEPALAAAATVREHGTPVAVAHQYRYHAWARAIAERLRDGLIGEVYTVHLEHSYYQVTGVPWLRQHGRYVTVSVNCHYYDLLRHFLRDEFDRVYAHVGQEPTRRTRPDDITGDTQTIAVMHMRRGAVVSLFAHEDTRGGVPAWPHRLALCGTEGSLFYEYRPPPDGPRLELYTDRSGEREPVPLERDAPASNLLLLRDFLGSLREGRPFATRVDDHLRTLAVGFACHESSESGRVVAVRRYDA